MALVVEAVRPLNLIYRNGDPFWDGDQTLHWLLACDGKRRRAFRVVVPRGDAFITPEQVKWFVEESIPSLENLGRRERLPPAGGRPEVALDIVPADVLPPV